VGGYGYKFYCRCTSLLYRVAVPQTHAASLPRLGTNRPRGHQRRCTTRHVIQPRPSDVLIVRESLTSGLLATDYRDLLMCLLYALFMAIKKSHEHSRRIIFVGRFVMPRRTGEGIKRHRDPSVCPSVCPSPGAQLPWAIGTLAACSLAM